jgi:YVTN family beta-propeller protein
MSVVRKNRNVPNTFSLIYPSDCAGCRQVIFIDNAVKNSELFFNSVNSKTFPIIYSISTSKAELILLLKANFISIDRIAFVFTTIPNNTKMFLDCQPFFNENESNTWPYSENVTFLINLLKEFNVRNIDFLGCNTLNYPIWVNYYNILSKEAYVIIGASNDKTSNKNYGGNWITENTNQSIEFIYFTKSIEYYSCLLDDTSTVWANTGRVPEYMCIWNGYLYVSNFKDKSIGKISLKDPVNDNNQRWATTLSNPCGIVVTDGYLYVTNYNKNTIGKISLTDPVNDNNQFWGLTGARPEGIAVYDGYLYVTNLNDDTIGKISLTDPKNDNNQKWATTGSTPTGITISNGYIYVSNCTDNTVGKISLTDPKNDNNKDWVTVGIEPYGLCIVNDYLYVTNYGSQTIGRIDLIDPTNLNDQNWKSVGNGNLPIGCHAYGSYLYVTNGYGNNTIIRYILPDVDFIPEVELNSVVENPIEPNIEEQELPKNDSSKTMYIQSSVCFSAGTPIKTDQGIIPIEKLIPYTHTIHKKPILHITKTFTKDEYLVVFKKNALGVNYPNDNTVMARGNKIYFEGRMQYVEYFLGKYSNVVKSNYTGEVLYNVLLEEQSRIYVNKLICETLHPSNEVAKLYMNGYKLIDNAQNDETIVKKNEKKTLDNSLRYFYFQFSDNK